MDDFGNTKTSCWDQNIIFEMHWKVSQPDVTFCFVLSVFQTWRELRMVAWGCSSGATPSRSSASEVQATPESPEYDSITKETRLQSHTYSVWTGKLNTVVNHHHTDVKLFLALQHDCVVMWACQMQPHFHSSSHNLPFRHKPQWGVWLQHTLFFSWVIQLLWTQALASS